MIGGLSDSGFAVDFLTVDLQQWEGTRLDLPIGLAPAPVDENAAS